MRISHAVLISQAVLIAGLGLSAGFECFAQSRPASGAIPVAAPVAAPAPAPSAILQPSLDTVLQAVTAVRLEKWKRGTVRDETGDHITAIEHDLQGTLPPLLKAADANAGTLSKVLPVTRNAEALYDVLVSVVEAARVSGPADQVTRLEQALSGLGTALRSLDDRVQQIAATQEQQTIDLRKTVQTLTAAKNAAAAPPPAKPCPVLAPARKPKKKPPTTTTPASPGAAPATAKPAS
ncbi:MAG: hypothetical protein ABSF28_25610 [Terracidiphilus sp.]|jgi:hypothetical protein